MAAVQHFLNQTFVMDLAAPNSEQFSQDDAAFGNDKMKAFFENN